jgi:hypothetical protein
MAVFDNGFIGNGIRNKLGNAVYYIGTDKQQVARQYVPDPANPRTEAQQLNRVRAIGVAKFAKSIWRNRDITWLCLKKEKGSYYNTIFTNIYSNPEIDFNFVGAEFGWAFTDYRVALETMVQRPITIWQGKAGISSFEFYNTALYVQDPFNPQWSFGTGVKITQDFYATKGRDNQVLALTIVSLTQGYARTQEFNLTRIEARAEQTEYLTYQVGITAAEVGNVYCFLCGFVDRDNGNGLKRNTSQQYICGWLKYEGLGTTFTINPFEFQPNFQ